MSNERQKRLMQEALDANLTPEAYQELRRQLDADAESTAQFTRLKKVDHLLRAAPVERAPQRLALSIMARLAESLKPQHLTRVSGLALALGLSLVMLVTLPILVAAVSLFLSAASSAAALNNIIQQIVGLLAVVVSMLETFVEGAQTVVSAYPQAPVILVAVVPVVLFWLLRYVNKSRQQAEQDEVEG